MRIKCEVERNDNAEHEMEPFVQSVDEASSLESMIHVAKERLEKEGYEFNSPLEMTDENNKALEYIIKDSEKNVLKIRVSNFTSSDELDEAKVVLDSMD